MLCLEEAGAHASLIRWLLIAMQSISDYKNEYANKLGCIKVVRTNKWLSLTFKRCWYICHCQRTTVGTTHTPNTSWIWFEDEADTGHNKKLVLYLGWCVYALSSTSKNLYISWAIHWTMIFFWVQVAWKLSQKTLWENTARVIMHSL